MNPLIISLIFIATYTLIIFFRKYALIILLLAIIALFFTGMTFSQMLTGINFNILGVFLGTMILSTLFIYSEVPAYLADKIISYTKKTSTAFLLICGLSAFISAFTENIATVFIVAPLALELCKKLKINPTALLIALSIASNLQGTSTLIGDAPSIILAMQTGMNFNDFFWINGKPGIFFAIQFASIGAFLVLFWFFRKYKKESTKNTPPQKKVKSWMPTILMALMSIHLAVDPILPFHSSLASICLLWAAISVLWYAFQKKEKISLFKELDWETLFFLTGIFILIQALVNAGIINLFAQTIYNLSAGSVFKAYFIIIIFSVFISAFVDNIPYTIAMIPVAQTIAIQTNSNQFLFVYGLLIGTCLGGNITSIGSSSNIVTAGLLHKNKIIFKNTDFIRIGFPFTLITVIMATSFIWFFYK